MQLTASVARGSAEPRPAGAGRDQTSAGNAFPGSGGIGLEAEGGAHSPVHELVTVRARARFVDVASLFHGAADRSASTLPIFCSHESWSTDAWPRASHPYRRWWPARARQFLSCSEILCCLLCGPRDSLVGRHCTTRACGDNAGSAQAERSPRGLRVVVSRSLPDVTDGLVFAHARWRLSRIILMNVARREVLTADRMPAEVWRLRRKSDILEVGLTRAV